MDDKNKTLSNVTNLKLRNGIDLVLRLERSAALAALSGIARSFQFSMIGTADFMVREANKLIPEAPTLDLRNKQDEYARYSDVDMNGDSPEKLIAQEFGFEIKQTPEERLLFASGMYYALVHEINARKPANQYEHPKSIYEAVIDFQTRGVGLTEAQLNAMKAVELEPGEFDLARGAAIHKRNGELAERKPRIVELLEDARNTDNGGVSLDDFADPTKVPVATQLRLMIAGWKGIYYRRKGLVTFVARSGKLDELAAVKLLEADLKTIEAWCREFEKDNSALFDAMEEADMPVYTIDDAIADVKERAKQQRR